jgi:biotin transport system substrate-specific component
MISGQEENMRQRVNDLVLISLFAALTAVGAFIKIPIPYVPLTLQTLMVMFAGLILGSRRGALSQILYLTIGLIGLPIFAHGGGPGYVLQPSFGFLLGFIAGAYVIGKVSAGQASPGLFRTVTALLLGQAVIYACGLSVLYLNLNFIVHKEISFPTTLKIGLLAFIPGDLLKTAIAVVVMAPVRRRLAAIRT